MTYSRCERAAELRDLVFYRGDFPYYWYVIWDGCDYFRADTLQGAYRHIMSYPRV